MMAVTTPALAPLPVAHPSSRRGWGRRWLRGTGWLGHLCAAVILIAAVVAVIGPSIAPFPPSAVDLRLAYVAPTGGHLLGFDAQGRDLLSRLLVGARTSMLGPLAVVLLAMAAGVVVAVVSAWHGGWLDSVVSSVMDVLFAFPGILLAVLAAAVFGPSITAAVLSLAVAYTPYVARIVRGAALRERGQPYVAALEVQGVSATAICLRHIIVNVRRLVVAEATILFGWAMLDLAALSFLGLGVQPPTADWGVMVSEAETGVLQGYPAEALAAGTAIVVVVVAFNVLGERLNDRDTGGSRGRRSVAARLLRRHRSGDI